MVLQNPVVLSQSAWQGECELLTDPEQCAYVGSAGWISFLDPTCSLTLSIWGCPEGYFPQIPNGSRQMPQIWVSLAFWHFFITPLSVGQDLAGPTASNKADANHIIIC